MRPHPVHGTIEIRIGALVTNSIEPTVIDGPGPPNVILEEATVTLQCALLPDVGKDEFESELREALGPGDYTLEVTEPEGGLTSPTGTPLQDAIEQFLAERDPEARVIPTLGYGFSDCHTMRESYGTTAYGFIPFRHADPMVNLTTKHGVDERVLIDDLVFQVEAALHIARSIGSSTNGSTAAAV
jgi:acetylornithine deacetylase/succinyl-diaminopimelate desuccinylase-like protein